jgi:hypothetical protein
MVYILIPLHWRWGKGIRISRSDWTKLAKPYLKNKKGWRGLRVWLKTHGFPNKFKAMGFNPSIIRK